MMRIRRAALWLAAAMLALVPFIQGTAPADRGPVVPILTYHSVFDVCGPGDGDRVLPVAKFEDQLRWLRAEGYTTLFLAEFLEIREGKRPCPDKPVILTFDDGYADNCFEVYPLLRKYGCKATFFVVVGTIGYAGHMTWRQLGRLDPEVVELGSHTMRHCPLGEAPLARVRRELNGSRFQLENFLRRPVDTLSFPVGSHSDEARAEAAKLGYRVAVTTDYGFNDPATCDPLALKRIHVSAWHTLEQFARRMDPDRRTRGARGGVMARRGGAPSGARQDARPAAALPPPGEDDDLWTAEGVGEEDRAAFADAVGSDQPDEAAGGEAWREVPPSSD